MTRGAMLSRRLPAATRCLRHLGAAAFSVRFEGMDWFDRLPQYIKSAFFFGGTGMSTGSGQLPVYLQTIALYIGLILIVIGMDGTVRHLNKEGFFRSVRNLRWPLIGSATPPPVPLQMALSVGSFSADFTQIKKLLRFDISLVLFNHRIDHDIAIEAAHGHLAFEHFTTMAEVSLAEPVKVLPYPRYGVSVTIRQGVNNEEKDRICEILASGEMLVLDFDLIKFFVREPGSAPEDIKIHNLTRITCRNPKEGEIICGGWVALSGASMR